MSKKTSDPRVECAYCHATYYLRFGKCPNCHFPPRPTNIPDLTRTRKMLAWYDRQEARRNKRLDDAIFGRSKEDPNKVVDLWEIHANAVRKAFYLDTKDRNSMDHCKCVDLSWLRKISSPDYVWTNRRPIKRRTREKAVA